MKKNVIPTVEKSYYMHEQKKQVSFRAPDISKMQAVKIDERTKIYISLEDSPEEARARYLDKMKAK
jgi:hypothetical protein